MITDILILVVGLVLVVLGADWLVDGSSSIARKAGLSEFVIGLTIVGIGTSSPELVVSLTGALKGNADIAIGNVVGSNIFNVLFILGFTALVRPIAMTRENVKVDIPINIVVTILLILFGMHHTLFGIGSENTLSRLDGIVFLLLFAGYMYWSFTEIGGPLGGFDADGIFRVGYFSYEDCEKAGIRDAVSFGPVLIMNGEKLGYDILESGIGPRTAIGQRQDKAVVMLAVDGRQAYSIGLTYMDCADILFDKYGCVNAINMDGGNSTCMFFSGEMINNPSNVAGGTRNLPTTWLIRK